MTAQRENRNRNEMTKEQIDEITAANPSMEDAILVGNVGDRERYFPAIVGFDAALGIFKYDYDLLSECFAKDFARNCGDDWDSLPPARQSEYFSEGAEWVDYNVIRALPYYGEHAPVVLFEGCDMCSEE